ncbi:MAG TPA: hypothetical protein VIM33_04280 [Gaiellaceae bacterium]|jgi:hypothetical protein
MARQRQATPLDALYGGRIQPAAQALKGMRGLESDLEREFKQHAAYRDELKSLSAPVGDSLGRILGDEQGEAVRGLAALDQRLGRAKLSPPAPPAEIERLSSGSISANVVPPLNYQWTWNAQNGGATVSTAATASNGRMSFNLWNNGRDATAWGRAAVGIYFRPIFANGILRISSNPAFNFNWWTICAFASAHSDAFIGLYVGKYTLAGGFDSAPVSQQVSLWNDDSWWSGASGSGSNSGFPLSAWISVDNAHWYAIWIWCGGSVHGSGWGTFSGSGAGANLAVTVPSIMWELF